MKATTLDGYRLLHEGSLCLSQIESNGIQIDTDYLYKTIESVTQQIRELESVLRDSDVFAKWRKRFGAKTELGSRVQLGTVIFDDLGYERKEVPKFKQEDEFEDKEENDQAAFDHVNLPFIKDYFKCEKLKKLNSTYLGGVLKETVDGRLHPFFDLHTVQTWRSSSSRINFQNIPIRNPEIGPIIRKCFVARKGRQLLEVDFKGIEVRVSCCYHKDPQMIKEFTYPDQDPHGYTAMQLFSLTKEQLDKKTARDWAKNRFVFPEFYGSVFSQCASNIWKVAGSDKFKLPDGTPFVEHLKSKGIKKLGDVRSDGKTTPGTFLHRVKEVENDFWNNRFVVYTQWKKQQWNNYLRTGEFVFFTGFKVSRGDLRKNQVLNWQIQGTSFHCLLWSLIQIQKWLRKNKMKTKIVGQIHDSMILDVAPGELKDVLAKIKEVTSKRLRENYKWIIVDMAVEADLCEVGASWADKKAVEL